MLNVLIKSKDINENNLIKNEFNFIINPKERNLITLLKNYNLNYLFLDFNSLSNEFILSVKAIKSYDKRIKIIVMCDFIHESLIRFLYDNGVDAILIRPLDLEQIMYFISKTLEEERLISMHYERSKSLGIEKKMIGLLNNLGMPANLKGYSYIKEAINLCSKDPGYYVHTKSCLYPKLAKTFETTASCIEKAIRNAIELCWIRGDIKEQEKVFGYTINRDKGRPTNGEFLAQVMNYLEAN